AAPVAGPTLADAIARYRARDLEGANELLERIVSAAPEDARAWSFLGQIRRLRGDLDGALAAYQRALAADPERYPAVYGSAVVHAQRGDADRAFELLRQLKRSGRYDLSQITLDADLAGLRQDPRFADLLMKPEDFLHPFVEPVRVIHEWRGEAPGDEFGWVARNAGDVDGDGVADVATSAPSKDLGGAQAGRIYVYSGAGGTLLWSASGAPGDRLGLAVEAAGDVDGDGGPDVVASAPGADRIYVYRGRDGAPILTLEAAQAGESFGRDVVGVGDVDGDGRGDLLVGAPQNDAAGEDAGRAALYSGADGAVLYEWRGEEAGDRLGAAVAGRAADGTALFALGAPDAGAGDRGRVYVYDGPVATPRFVIGSDDAGAELGGMFLSLVGDVDGDGVPDVYASDWSHGAKGPTTGRIVVHSGADGRRLLAMTGEAAGDGFGIGVADAGDVDRDGHDDLVIGAWQHAGAAPAGGKVYLVSGGDGSLLRAITCRVMGDTFGFDATGLGDVDGDGRIDLLLTSAWSAVNGAKSGRVFVVAGE
ncbi:MAG: tetratricopeptide repeat protein, partial [Acidobacteria bacterium]